MSHSPYPAPSGAAGRGSCPAQVSRRPPPAGCWLPECELRESTSVGFLVPKLLRNLESCPVKMSRYPKAITAKALNRNRRHVCFGVDISWLTSLPVSRNSLYFACLRFVCSFFLEQPSSFDSTFWLNSPLKERIRIKQEKEEGSNWTRGCENMHSLHALC